MRLLQATKIVEAEPGWRDEILRRGPVVIDVGAGDGRFVYESARHDPSAVYIGLDPDAEALAEYAFRAARKPSRGGAANTFFVIASVEQLPPELERLAGRVLVNFPWGGLLRGVILPEPVVLNAIASLATPAASFEIVFCYDLVHDAAVLGGDDLPVLDERYIDTVLVPAYAAAGLQVTGRRLLPRDEALAIPSTWGRRLLHGRPRDVFLVRGLVFPKPAG